MRIIGVLLIVFGVLALSYGAIRYTQREKVFEIGPLQATTEQQHEIPLPPIAGIAAIAGGAVLLWAGTRTRA